MLFRDTLNSIQNEIPMHFGIDGKLQNTVNISSSQLELNATCITEYSSNLGYTIPI